MAKTTVRKKNRRISEGNVFIDLTCDFAFHLIFAKRGNEDLLLKLVRAILPRLDITSVRLVNQVEVGMSKKSRTAVMDVRCTTAAGEEIVIEMQCGDDDDLGSRMIFYSTFPIQNGVKRGRRGTGKFNFNDVYVVAITDFVMKPTKGCENPINHYSIRNEAYPDIGLSENVHYVTVELPKLKADFADEENPDELILYAIRDIGKMTEIPEKFLEAGLEKLFNLCMFAGMNARQQDLYIREFMGRWRNESRIRTAKRIGLEEGHEEGFAKGIAEGRAKGRAEQTRIIARNMLDASVPIEVVMSTTGLSAEDIASL